MTDLYTLALLRGKELREQAERARRLHGDLPPAPARRARMATWLVALATRLSPETTTTALGGTR